MRLLLVWQADPAGTYSWMPPPAAGDVVVSFDVLAIAQLRTRDAVLYDALVGWEQRAVAERRITRILAALRNDEALATLAFDGHRLAPFMEYRARGEFAHVLRGFDVARASPGCDALVVDPATPDAVVIGARCGLGLDDGATPYEPDAPAVTPPPLRRLAAQATMRAMAATTSSRSVRIAAVLNAKVAPAVLAVPRAQLRTIGLAAMPFPGLDYGNSARLAKQLRIPLLATLDPLVARPRAQPLLRAAPDLGEGDPQLAAALARVTSALVTATWPTFVSSAQAVRALERVAGLRALLLPTTAVGVSRMLMDWAHERGLAVAAVQHGIYGFKEHDGGDSRADVLFAWSTRVGEQARAWPVPRPRIVAVGVPGMARAERPRAPRRERPRHVLVATTWRALESAIAPTSFHEQFIAVVADGLRTLIDAGVNVELRLHPIEDRAVYRRILAGARLALPFAAAMPFPQAAAATDLLVSGPSSVAFEAGALGLPVLLWNGGMSSAMRADFLVPPLSLDLAGMFGDAAQFDALVAQVLGDEPATGTALAAELGSYAAQFEPAAFADALQELAA